MSVDDSRFAAAQRTAATRREPLGRRLKVWLVIVPTLVFFASMLAGGAAAFGKPDYAKAAKDLPNTGALVLVSASTEHDSWLDHMRSWNGQKALCSVTPAQLQQLAAHYNVEYLTIKVGGHTVQIAKVSGKGANDRDLREYLGDAKMKCKVIRIGGVFFLPFDPHGS